MSRRRQAVAAVLAASALGCSSAARQFAAAGADPPAGALGSVRPIRPEVTGVWFSGGGNEPLAAIVRFSEPMDRASVAAALSVRASTATVLGPGDGNALRNAAEPSWNPASTEVLVQTAAAGAAIVVLVIDAAARGANGLAIDGSAPPRPGRDARGYHRVENDGFSGPETYLSLPYYPLGSAILTSHPTMLLDDSRPRLGCAAAGTPVTTGDLGVAAGGVLHCQLLDTRTAPVRPGLAERRAPRAWDPRNLPQAVFDNGGERIAGTVTLGKGAAVEPRDGWTVFAASSRTSLDMTSLSFSRATSDVRLFVLPTTQAEPAWAVDSVAPPSTLNIAAVLYRSDAGLGTDAIADDAAAWIAGEFAGQRFENGGGGARITGNSAAELQLDAVSPCFQCSYRITVDVGQRYGQGSRIRVTSDYLEFRPARPLAPGVWNVHVSGGADLLGLKMTDGIRDGDEVHGQPDDTAEFTITIP